jgi:predicted adenine nucleotide alpha hydrolase (AANH) superfamily ATPase
MASYSKEAQAEHTELISSALAVQPRASLRTVQSMLEKVDRHLNIHYISKIIKKVKAERIHRFDRSQVNERIAEMQDKTQAVQNEMWKIVYSKTAEDKDKVAAAKVIVTSERELFQSQLDAGIYTRKLGEFSLDSMEDEDTRQIMNAMENYGIIEVVAEVVEQKQIPDANKNNRKKVQGNRG